MKQGHVIYVLLYPYETLQRIMQQLQIQIQYRMKRAYNAIHSNVSNHLQPNFIVNEAAIPCIREVWEGNVMVPAHT